VLSLATISSRHLQQPWPGSNCLAAFAWQHLIDQTLVDLP
jgi:hypothetical protein